jgi:hypothetical protein
MLGKKTLTNHRNINGMASVLHIAFRVEFQSKETSSSDAWFENHFLVQTDSRPDFVYSKNSQQVPKFSLSENFMTSHNMVITAGCKAVQGSRQTEEDYEGMYFDRYICPLGQGAETDVCIMTMQMNDDEQNETDVDAGDSESVRRFSVGNEGDDLGGLSGTFSITIVADKTELVDDEGSLIRKVFMKLDVERFVASGGDGGGQQTDTPSSFLQTHVSGVASRTRFAMFY